jgi:hypothetical protein
MAKLASMRTRLLATLALAGCGVGPVAPAKPAPPALAGDFPAVGRPLDLSLQSLAGGVRLTAVPGRVTVVCLDPGEGGVLSACSAVQARFGDRVAVVGVSFSPDGPLTSAPFRVFRDANGAAVKEKLELPAEPAVLLVDRQGRVRDVVKPRGEVELEERVEALHP